jgi:ribosomal protein S18 acetylase RimI-like enzyme
MKLKIRRANKSDFSTLWKVLTTTPELQSDSDGDTYDKGWLKSVLSTPKENLVLIAEDNKKLVGFAIVHYLRSVKQSIVNDLFVVEECRNKGIASMLMKECEKDAWKNNFKYITGLVRTNNKKMQKLKEKLGYKKGNSLYFYEKRKKI